MGDEGASEDKNPVHCPVRQPRELMLGCRDVTMPLNAAQCFKGGFEGVLMEALRVSGGALASDWKCHVGV